MHSICPKCTYERRSTDIAPDRQCPSCGIAYVKFLNPKTGTQPMAPGSKRQQSSASETNVRVNGAMKLFGAGIAYAAVIAFVISKGGLSEIHGGPVAAISMGTPGAFALAGLFELITNVRFTAAASWWDELSGWQRGVLGVFILVLAFVLMMVGVVLFA